ncbi:DUF2897 family protein [Shewanella glacialipiscicola]|uniref:DUF2897 domain-containing protein n=1 Tax=Shewanella glacialipiscicola TaxID=614069 RepID=A0ABQ6J1F8_9GAMM|nr:DUF2897 family protein [Shewanella glacialipiscicola]MCL1085931.1 DUF2897 family protein [Shewanella glacialipiscicola]MCU7993407.1 DUF2897 family protein [Shewanella glacialipiscicola]MCU8024724.1 DUF2897 family protein [Shewanella glacialipiscicola]GIU14286.1 hypothetical protein TUM4636_25750 [Shewanella glacialipiscicola]GMA81960.1 hypothetical protein GCM10025855_14930 [Shewanella glacialipiscicola]
MSTLEVWILIILILGVIASNLAALKYSAKFKLPQFGQHDKDKQLKTGANAANDDPDKMPSEAGSDTPLQPTSAIETSSEPNTKDRKE